MNGFELPELPKSFEINSPRLNCDTVDGIGRALENKKINDIYEAAYYGFSEGRDRYEDCLPDEIFTSDQMIQYAKKAVKQALENQWKPIDTTPKDGEYIFSETVYSERITKAYFDKLKKSWIDNETHEIFYPKYWIELPKPPRDKE